MMYILNDYSINSQFDNIDGFLDSLFSYTIPLFITMEKYNIKLLKSYQIFNLKITRDVSISELLKIRNYPEVYKVRALLHRLLMDNPYWESDDSCHDCLDEAFKRNAGMISFEHNEYLLENIEYMHEGFLQLIPNSYNKIQLLGKLRKKGIINVGQYLENKFCFIQSFCNINGKNYFEVFVKENTIKSDEVDKIVNDLNDFMVKYSNKQDLGELSKNLEPNLYEFRTTIADSRKVRIFYCLNQSKLLFLNCFIKKQQKTPESEKKLARRLRDSMT